jgi:hypothetical protein
MDFSNPQIEQEIQDTELQLRAAEAEYKNLDVKVQSESRRPARARDFSPAPQLRDNTR